MNSLIAIILLAAALIFVTSTALSWVFEPPIDPPVAIIKRRFGKIVHTQTNSDWIILIPYVHTFEKIPITQFKITIADLKVTTPDNVSSAIKNCDILVRPIPENDMLKKYIGSGKQSGITSAIIGIAEQEIRQWARTPDQDPKDWQELQSCQDKLGNKLKNKLVEACGGNLENDPSQPLCLLSYGVYLDTITIGEIDPEEGIAQAKELEAKEKLERKGELAETETELEIAVAISKKLGISKEKSFKMMQDYKMLKANHGTIHKFSFSDVSELIKLGKDALNKLFSEAK